MSLPDLVLDSLFFQFTNSELLPLRLVCREWETKIQAAYRGSYYRNSYESPYEMVNFKKLGPYFKNIRFNSTEFGQVENLVKLFTKLNALSLTFHGNERGSRKAMKKMNRMLINNKIVDFRITVNERCNLNHIFHNIETIERLKLDFSSLEKDAASVVFQNVKSAALKKLIMHVDISEQMFTAIETKFPKLEELTIHPSNNYDEIDELLEQEQTFGPNNILPKLPDLRKLTVENSDFKPHITLPNPNTYPKLEYLNLSLKDIRISKFSSSKWTNIKELDLKAEKVEWLGLPNHFPNIKSLTLSGELENIFHDSIAELQELGSLSDLKLDSKLSSTLIDAEPTLPNLKQLKLVLDYEKVPKLLAYCSSKLPDLTELELEVSELNSPIFRQLDQTQLKQMSSLKTLKLDIHQKDLTHLFLFLTAYSPNLYRLDLNYNADYIDASARFSKAEFKLPELMILNHRVRFGLKDYMHLLKLAPKLVEINPEIDEFVLNYLRKTYEGNRVLVSMQPYHGNNYDD